MREILFKAKRVDNGEWIEGSLVHQTDYYGDKVDDYFIIDGTSTQDNDIGYEYRVDPETICQYTGMNDKYGKKIWEHDKCEVYRFCVFAHGTIKFLEGCFCFVEDGTGNILRLCDIRTNNYEIKVVGGMDDGQK